MPDEDEGRFMVTFKTPTGAAIEYTRAFSELLRDNTTATMAAAYHCW